MACRRPGDKPLFELMVVSLLTNICVTRPQWVAKHSYTYIYSSVYWCNQMNPFIARQALVLTFLQKLTFPGEGGRLCMNFYLSRKDRHVWPPHFLDWLSFFCIWIVCGFYMVQPSNFTLLKYLIWIWHECVDLIWDNGPLYTLPKHMIWICHGCVRVKFITIVKILGNVS